MAGMCVSVVPLGEAKTPDARLTLLVDVDGGDIERALSEDFRGTVPLGGDRYVLGGDEGRGTADAIRTLLFNFCEAYCVGDGGGEAEAVEMDADCDGDFAIGPVVNAGAVDDLEKAPDALFAVVPLATGVRPDGEPGDAGRRA